jgi:hypothetical protein
MILWVGILLLSCESEVPDPPSIIDADGDGYTVDEDCNDDDDDVNPRANEECNEIDDNCDGQVDEESVDSSSWFADQDADGFGDPNNEILDCNAPTGYLEDNTDCNDQESSAHPGSMEVDDGVDNDCDGVVDEPEIGVEDQSIRLLGAEGWRVGSTIKAAGDLNSDGYEDLAIFASGAPGAEDDGVVFVVRGPITDEMELTEADVTLSSSLSTVHQAGDVTGDGCDDLFVEAERESTWLVSGIEIDDGTHSELEPYATIVDTREVGDTISMWGMEVAGGGDVNGDEIAME